MPDSKSNNNNNNTEPPSSSSPSSQQQQQQQQQDPQELTSVLDKDKANWQFTHTNYIHDAFDLRSTLHFMFAKRDTPGVRDYLIHKLYEFPISDIDKILPQLVHLYVVWPSSMSHALSEYLSKLCTRSIHIGLKIILMLEASVAYLKSNEDQARVRAFRNDCEMSVVNAELPKFHYELPVSWPQGAGEASAEASNATSSERGTDGKDTEQDGISETERQIEEMLPNIHFVHSEDGIIFINSSPQKLITKTKQDLSSSPSSSAAVVTATTKEQQQQQQQQPLAVNKKVKVCRVCDTALEHSISKAEMLDIVNYLNNCAMFGSLQEDLRVTKRVVVHLSHQQPSISAMMQVLYMFSAQGRQFTDIEELSQAVAAVASIEETCGFQQQNGRNAKEQKTATTVGDDDGGDEDDVLPTSPTADSAKNLRLSLFDTSSDIKKELFLVDDDDDEEEVREYEESELLEGLGESEGSSEEEDEELAAVAAYVGEDASSLLSSSSSAAPAAVTTTVAVVDAKKEDASLQSPSGLNDDEVKTFLSKRVRSEYFTRCLAAISTLEELSFKLIACAPEKRLAGLRQYCEVVLTPQLSGLYFPCVNVDAKHYAILSVCAQDCFTLNSRDKVPFLLTMEVQYTGHLCKDPVVYEGFAHVLFPDDEEEEEVLDLNHLTGNGETEEEIDYFAANGGASEEEEEEEEEELEKKKKERKRERMERYKQIMMGSTSSSSSSFSASSSSSSSVSVAEQQQQFLNVAQDTADPTVVTLSNNSNNTTTTSTATGDDRISGKALRTLIFGEDWEEKKARVASTAHSAFSRLDKEEGKEGTSRWDVKSFIFKGGDDCRQELLAMQLISFFEEVFKESHIPLRLRPYDVLVTGGHSGMIETVPNAVSIDGLKKQTPGFVSLLDTFIRLFGQEKSSSFKKARANFVHSMAAYSLVCYILQIKDRHNGNILIDSSGHVIHIDYGFMLSASPGGNMNFESAPFKLTQELLDVMGPEFHYFKMLMIRGFLEIRKSAYLICSMVECNQFQSTISCFIGGANTLKQLEKRFHLDKSGETCVEIAISLVEESANNWRTVQYDSFQRLTNGIL